MLIGVRKELSADLNILNISGIDKYINTARKVWNEFYIINEKNARKAWVNWTNYGV